MAVLAMVNMLILLVGFLSGLRARKPVANRGMATDPAANQACVE